jgi:hypothetical protein
VDAAQTGEPVLGLGHNEAGLDFFLLVSRVDSESILDAVSCFFSLAFFNQYSDSRQNSINREVINRHRNYDEVCIGSALNSNTSSKVCSLHLKIL